MRVLKAGAVYFGSIFAVGVFLQPVRDEWAVPRFGPVGGLLLEAAVMLPAMVIAAVWIVRRFDVPSERKTRLRVGFAALGFLLVAEIAGALLLRGLPVGDWLAGFGTAPGLFSLALLFVFAAMPSFVRP